MSFLPAKYEVPQSGGKYMKLEQGDNTFRVLGEALLGYLDWKDKTPVRMPYTPEKRPKPIDPKRAVKHFWAFPVWNYKKNAVQILEITQAGIQNSLYGYINDDAWGDPTKYDLTIKRSGEGMDTEYVTIAKPPKALQPEAVKAWKETTIDLKKLMTNDDPFVTDRPTVTGEPNYEADLPF